MSQHGNGLAIELGPLGQLAECGEGTVMHQPTIITLSQRVCVGKNSRIDSFVKIEGGQGVVIGDHVHLASFCHVNVGGGKTVIENGAAMASGARTISGGNQPDSISCSASAPADQQVVGVGEIVLEENSILYSGATVYSGPGKKIVIGRGARIGANSYVSKSVPAGEIWAGNPAKFIRNVTV